MVSNSEKNEKSLAEFITIIALVGVMMAMFINYFIKSEPKFTHAGFSTLAQQFNSKVNAVHAQWLMDKKPEIVIVASFNNKKQVISVNNAGWVDVKQKQLACEAIWQLIMETPMNLLQLSISAIEVHDNTNEQYDQAEVQCQYVLLDGSFFNYNRANGNVSKVTKLN